ncbi:MAG: TolC family protein [Candidatus Binataceae bacterium]|nr:TolC family protein [Candidatus Binataceae bacterium]
MSASQTVHTPTVSSDKIPAYSTPLFPTPPGITTTIQSRAATPPRGLPIRSGQELTLKRAIEIALKYHPRVREAIDNTAAAHERIGEARSYLGPQLYGSGQYLRSTYNGIGNTSYYDQQGLWPRMTGRNHDLPANNFAQNWVTGNNYMGGLALSQFLFDFGRRQAFVSQREFEAKAATAREQLTDLDLIFEVSQRYFRLLEAQKLIGVYQKAVEQRKFHLHEAEVKAKAGLRPELDVYVTRAELERSELHLVDARNAQLDAKVALDNALGLTDLAPRYVPSDVLTYSPVSQPLAPLLENAFHLRPDLQMMKHEVRAMGAQIVEYRSDYFPTVNGVAGYAGMGTGLPMANNFNAGIVISWPIFNSFLTTHQLAESRFRRKAIESAMDDLRQQITLQVKTAYLNWQASIDRIRRAQQALIASRGQMQLSDQRYTNGLTDIVELEDAQRHYTEDDAVYADALYRYSIAKAAVDQATGESLDSM